MGLLCSASIGTGALAQESDVVMRRPLPIKERSGSTPTTPTPPSTNPGTTNPDPDGCAQDWSCDYPAGTTGYGYGVSCGDMPGGSSAQCYRAEVTDQEWQDVSLTEVGSDLCMQSQNQQGVTTASMAGLIPGGSALDVNKVCHGPSIVYGWDAGCFFDGSAYATCMSIDSSNPTGAYIRSPSMCDSFVPSAEAAAFMQEIGMKNSAQKDVAVSNCQSGGGPGTPPEPAGPEIGSDPGLNPNDPPSDGGPGWYEWEIGDWQGEAVCGENSRLTRTVRCVKRSATGGPPMIPEPMSMQTGKSIGHVADGTVTESFSSDGQISGPSKAIWDPSMSTAKMSKAQFSTEIQYVDASECIANIGAKPGNVYEGDKANCEYEFQQDGLSEWKVDNGGNPTCSRDAYRTTRYNCIDTQTGDQVDKSYCENNLKTGGRPQEAVVREYGNFEGCTAEWENEGGDLGCHATTDPSSLNGPIHLVYNEYYCKRSDGEYLSGVQAEACDGPRPPDGMVNAGACHVNYKLTYDHSLCPAQWTPRMEIQRSLTNDFTRHRVSYFNGRMYEGGAAACAAAGALCCQEKVIYQPNSDVVKGYVTVGGDVPPQPWANFFEGGMGYGVYLDDGHGPHAEYYDSDTTVYVFKDYDRGSSQGSSPIWYTVDPPSAGPTQN